MAMFKATIEIFMDVENEGEACDAIAETLRPLLQEFSGPNSCFVDWQFLDRKVPVEATAAEVESLEYQPFPRL
jgi:hypothetical protein